MGNRGENETYRGAKETFWWEGMNKMVKKWVKSCEACQKRSHYHQKEEGRISFTSTLFERVSIDAIHVKSGRWKYLVVARDYFSGFPDTIGLVTLTARSVSEWVTSECICRYRAPNKVTVDGGPDFGKDLQDAVKKAGSKIRVTTSYYPESQGMVERGNKKFNDALVKMCGENGSKWKKYLPLVRLADRISTKRTTVCSPFELQFGQKAVLPIGLEAKTYLAIEWHKVRSTEDLLQARDEQLSGKEEMRKRAKEKLKKARDN
ncbi:hypothetical protein O181_054006 [Austropuccinia psidii MF-1]|uniref:Integrase catalytic domain-containing protein n=1 Tax=Austropuccinia psidii MF-1 TaxID=1389203 RepID=A0A9Q3E1M3_9BASI|nr:hypothetical protein [Austropuccinia psidii MF-1]